MSKKSMIKLKGHGSFYIREGWLRKGMRNVHDNPNIFAEDSVVDDLAVGANMILSIRYWLQATGLTYEKTIKGGKKTQYLTKGFGQVVYQYDPYFDDIFTLWIVHYKLAINTKMATSWYLFFNKFKSTEFTKEEMSNVLARYLEAIIGEENYSEKSLKDDCTCIIKTYYEGHRGQHTPEDKMTCPLSELGLLGVVESSDNQYYIKKKPAIMKLDKLVIFYIIVDNMHDTTSSNISSILEDEGNVGRILNLDRSMINEYIDELKNSGYLTVNRTSGLDKVYLYDKYDRMFKQDKEELKEYILRKYYEQ